MTQQLIDTFFKEDLPQAINQLKSVESSIDPSAQPVVDDKYRIIDNVLSQLVQQCGELEAALSHDADLLKETRLRFFEQIKPMLSKGWPCRRVVEKPRGYAGDYAILNAIYDHQTDTGYGGYVDLWLHHVMLPRSIRSRWQEMRKFLTKELSGRTGDVSILDIASGPCREFAEPMELSSDCTVHLQCLDNDPESLEWVRDNVVQGSGIEDFRLDRYNALRLKSSKATIREFGKFDIVYSIGLFDYIDDKRLVEILAGIKELVNEGGVVYLNFKDSERYDKIEYQWLMDWHFFQRTEQDCLDLFAEAGYELDFMEPTTRDETGVIINFVNRVSGKVSRIDEPATKTAAPKFAEQTKTEQSS